MKHDVAVLITTICRDSLLRAVQSVYNQNYSGRMQLLIGVDVDPDKKAAGTYKELKRLCPPHIDLVWLNPGYSTSVRHGGVHKNFFGGSMYSVLTFLANAEVVVYLDDDDWLHPDHVAQILKAIEGKKWAFSYSIYADGDTGTGLCIDELESVGVDRGMYKERFGGYVRPSGLAINKIRLLPLVHLWSTAIWASGDGSDRSFFKNLRGEDHDCTGNATVYYTLDPKDRAHPYRLEFMKSKGVDYSPTKKSGSVR